MTLRARPPAGRKHNDPKFKTTPQERVDAYHRALLSDRYLDMETGLESTRKRRIAMDALISRLEFTPTPPFPR